ncbi:hypothetical protein HZC09_06020 [Candidatus Micrarchaeota archaeon]|nr:hypothetical protein [Candidatus Micrarchaeota archaeon]
MSWKRVFRSFKSIIAEHSTKFKPSWHVFEPHGKALSETPYSFPELVGPPPEDLVHVSFSAAYFGTKIPEEKIDALGELLVRTTKRRPQKGELQSEDGRRAFWQAWWESNQLKLNPEDPRFAFDLPRQYKKSQARIVEMHLNVPRGSLDRLRTIFGGVHADAEKKDLLDLSDGKHIEKITLVRFYKNRKKK